MSVTIYDIAERTQVSIATVSRVLNNQPRVSEATRQRVLGVAHELGYQPHTSAQSLARQKPHLIAAIIPMITNFFFVEVMRGIQDRIADSAYDLVMLSGQTLADTEGQLGRALQTGFAAGVMLFSTPLASGNADALKRSGKPIVLVDAFQPEFDSVSVDSEQGGYTATRHLMSQGYERIGLILASPESVPAAQRQAGFLRAHREAGRAVDPSLMVASRDRYHDGYTEESGYQAMRTLLERRPRPEAVFVASDIQALGALKALQEAGVSVPDDIALIGFDDIKLSGYVGLSTLRQPMYEMGALSVEKLLSRIGAPDRPVSHTVFTASLVCRNTCGSKLRQQQAALVS